MPTLTLKGNNTGGTANPLDLTVAQVNAILPVFTSALNGLTPLSGGGTTNFLRADGTWTTIDLTSNVSNALPVGNGGTGQTSLTLSGLLVGNGTSPISVTPVGLVGQVLVGQGSGFTPVWEYLPTLGVAGTQSGGLILSNGNAGGGTVTVQNLSAISANSYNFNLPATAGTSGQVLTSGGGGTSAMTWTTVFTNPMTTAGDIIYENNTPTPARLAIGSTGQVLTVVSGLPAWSTPTAAPTLTSLGIFAGNATISSSATSVSITYSTAFGSTNYSITGTIANVTDANPAYISVTVTAKSTTGATFSWNTPVPTSSYVLNWHAILNN